MAAVPSLFWIDYFSMSTNTGFINPSFSCNTNALFPFNKDVYQPDIFTLGLSCYLDCREIFELSNYRKYHDFTKGKQLILNEWKVIFQRQDELKKMYEREAVYLAHSPLALEAAVSWKRDPLCWKYLSYFSESSLGKIRLKLPRCASSNFSWTSAAVAWDSSNSSFLYFDQTWNNKKHDE